jgi:hypothetical protein
MGEISKLCVYFYMPITGKCFLIISEKIFFYEANKIKNSTENHAEDTSI